MNPLQNGQSFPNLTADQAHDGEFSIPGDLTTDWSVLLCYRGEW